jgi:Heterokaryon incompatibility protein (HET)
VDPMPWGLASITEDSLVRVDVEVMAHDPPTYLTVGIVEQTDSTNWVGEDETELHHWIDLGIPVRGDVAEEASSEVSVSDSAERIAKYWLQDCLTNHQRCAADVPPLPTRVLDVISRPEPFLVIPEGKRATYATLSYSVGQFDLLKTTTETIDAYKTCIPIAQLPQTVRDAVELTRVLGLQFLWVDSLCIDQSSLADWEIELSTMAEIYRNSSITIAATASTNAGTGCRPVRNKLQLATCRPTPGVTIVPDYGRDKWIFQKGALETRAWTFQEVQLSPRVLRCGGEELVWQCRSCKRREEDPAAKTRHDTEALAVFFGTRTLDDFVQRKERSEKFYRWYQVVQEFVARDLTFAEDKLPAFSGMASHFSFLLGLDKEAVNAKGGEQTLVGQRRPLTYLCGLWREDILHGLVWRSIYPPSKPIRYRAPSWSWAAVEGGKIVYDMYSLRSDEFYAEALDVEVTVPGLNPFGRVTCGKLTLLGPIAPVPSQIYGDDSEIGAWEWKWPLLTWEHVGEPPLQSFCLRLQRSCCLILAAVGETLAIWDV